MATDEGGGGVPDAAVVLAIDDEPGILRLLRLELIGAGFSVLTATGGDEGIAILSSQEVDIVLLDALMPAQPGTEVLAEIKKRWPSLPVIVLSAHNTDAHRLEVMEAGADDFVTKPFSPQDLTIRIQSLLGRAAGEPDEKPVRIGGIQIDVRAQRVTRAGALVTLSRTEWMLLRRLIEANGEAALDQELLVKTWGREYRGDVEYLRIWMDRLRRKLGDDAANPQLIFRFQGVGYRLDTGAAATPPD